ncbi:PREDICTED: probable serine/threonine-protein kinase drkD [Amphimedon queenslandica]|uniref:Protein kinase domain-containing protein n=1 Tax=Amphimedon queenslandica TaxID=400682 RepID=A0AAN0IQE6_AMPQE|nr:PREDICTED: probable serine/threonine-protein kinase drkD [Amphimedon queenslandica]|eukprot:XP_011406875.2 PREDICTED: probable serine/threonine-protein kinase drkD [Amphimedon queenslandica]
MEVCHLLTGRWEQKPTTGNPPLGVSGYAAAAIGRVIFYFAGWCDWISPTVTGDRPPPIDEFTLTSINNSSAILFGGDTANGRSNNVYILNFTDTSVNCSKLSNPGGSVQWPEERRAHSSVLINTNSGPHLLVVGGVRSHGLWIFDIKNKSWKELFNTPKNVTNRYSHSLSLWSVTPTTNWIIVFGGEMSYTDTAVIELRYTSNNDWSTKIDRLTRVLQERERELQEERREKEQVRNRLQQQLQGREQQLQQVQQQGQERERQAREREENLQWQLQEREQQFQREVQQGGEREQDLRRQLQESQERERGLEQQLRERDRQEKESSWVVSRNDIRMTERILGRGGWGEVRVARFHGLEVAAKVLHETIISEYNVSLFSREMNIASKLRHPNLLQFIGATTEGNPIILTELMPTSLRKELETGGLAYHAVLNISLDVACALNYLHLFKPHPILHRDVSSANVLLQPMGGVHGGLRAKVSDYGSANLQHLIIRSVNPGGPLYAAPEAANPREHSPSMDVFSYGVLLLEMITRRIPLPEERVGLIDGIRRASFRSLVQRCLIVEYRHRPTMNDIITELNDTI